jgi:hypothetical protein
MKFIFALLLVVPCLAAAQECVLFAFDEQAIPWHFNTKVTLHSATKHPANPVLRKGPPGAPDHGHAILYGNVMHDGAKFRMWYLGMIESSLKEWAQNRWRPMCYAESKDGITWTKPDLGLVEIAGSKHNNACLIEGDPHSLTRLDDFLCVLHEPDAPDPTQRYKCVFVAHVPFADVKGGRAKIGPPAENWQALVTATSPDGLRWKVVGDRPANAGGVRFEVSGLTKHDGFYYASGQLVKPWTWRRDGREIDRVMMVYRSSDFKNWEQATALSFARGGQLITDPIAGQQTHMGAGLWNRGNVILGLYGMWQDGPKERPKGARLSYGVTADLGLILSHDAIHYHEPLPDHRVLTHDAQSWDSHALTQAHAFVNHGDKTMLWYSHWDTTGQLRGMEIGLATLRRDGFGDLSPMIADEAAHFVTATQPANPEGWRIKLNLEGVSEKSPLTLEVLDERGNALPGLSAEISQNGTQVPVTFPQAANTPPGTRIALRAKFREKSTARVFAIYLH